MSSAAALSDPPLVLVVDDDHAMRLMIRHALERDSYRVVETEDGEGALTAFAEHKPDLVLLDAIMPGMSGFEVCRRLHPQYQGHSCPVLVITGMNDDRAVDDAFAAGAADFILKPIHWAVLRQRARRLLAAVQAEKTIRQLAFYDTLTGLPNRVLFTDRFGHALASAQRHHHGLALLFIDLDGFKAVNDTQGHGRGDDLLRAVATELAAAVRETDTVARMGGDEFLVLLEWLRSSDDVVHIANRMLGLFKKPELIETFSMRVSASIGIAMHPQNGDSINTLIHAADQAMYQAKAAGGNRYAFALTQAAVDPAR